ncbi:MAG: type VI secretion system membrane subunit TssM [Pseudomonadota bacterium]
MKNWIAPVLTILGFACFCVLVLFALPLIAIAGAAPFTALWVRLTIIGVAAAILLLVWFLRWRKRRKGQEELEEALVEDQGAGDDSDVLGEKMRDALAVLKRSGGSRTFLYDLPWYLIIGPPGAGKTTALLNAGIEFPLAAEGQAAMSGIGGTRYCDWWFAEEAVMIDTAGRYTTQDSDAEADKSSWDAFLDLLKRNRPKQPINGIILALSLSDLMEADSASLAAHAETIRTRLDEIHRTLKIDFPVYVLFTKADLISGFREYFGGYSEARRKQVWGATFQTSNRLEQTYERAGEEFDALVERLSNEVLHRLSEEPDGISRIAIFSLPGQLTLLKPKITDLLRRVFEPTRYKTNAILRGFYFTSGTQEGNPIDQVLGAMQGFGSTAAGMSGKGKSFFLHDLMKKVIFAEQGWVSYDARAVKRSRFLRIGTVSAMLLLSAGLIGGWANSYFANERLVAQADAAITDYKDTAGDMLAAESVSDPDLTLVANPLTILRDMPGGYASESQPAPFLEGLGLGQRARLRSSARAAYRDGLERLFRPRLALYVEDQLDAYVRSEDGLEVYQTLKVYKLLGGDPSAIGDTDPVVKSWFETDWEDISYTGLINRPLREQLSAHLDAMLDLDDTVPPRIALNADLISRAEAVAARMPVAERAYALVMETASVQDIVPFNVADRAGRDAARVFEAINGDDLSSLEIPAIYTFDGFNEFFLEQLSSVADRLESDKWVLGPEAERARVDDQIGRLGQDLLNRYEDEFLDAWAGILDNLKLVSMSTDKPEYSNLEIAASSTTSPIMLLVEEIAAETNLTQAFDLGEAAPADGDGALDLVRQRLEARLLRRSTGWTAIGLNVALDGKNSARAPNRAGSSRQLLPGQSVVDEYRDFHLMVDGELGTRPIDGLVTNLGEVREVLFIAARQNQELAQAGGNATIGLLRSSLSRMPDLLNRMISGAIREFEGDAATASLEVLAEQIQTDVVEVCTDIIDGRFPFSNNVSRQVPLTSFAELFAPGGILDTFFNDNLARHADMTQDPWEWDPDSPIAERLSTTTLRQFQRAEAIRDAFFPARSPQPEVNMAVTLSSSHGTIRRVDMEVSGNEIGMRRNDPGPHTVSWGGASRAGGAKLTINKTRLTQGNSIGFDGAWAIIEFIQRGNPRTQGDLLSLQHNVDGRAIGLEIRFDSLTNPFTLPELSSFRCPQGL